MGQSSWDIDKGHLARATDRRTACLESNGYRCNKCGVHRERGQLVTVPNWGACICMDCWLAGESDIWNARVMRRNKA